MQISGFSDLPGGVVYDDVPPGTMMLVHSAVVCVPETLATHWRCGQKLRTDHSTSKHPTVQARATTKARQLLPLVRQRWLLQLRSC